MQSDSNHVSVLHFATQVRTNKGEHAKEDRPVHTERSSDDEQMSGGCGIMTGIRRSDQLISELVVHLIISLCNTSEESRLAVTALLTISMFQAYTLVKH
jgi:hypothetical protein